MKLSRHACFALISVCALAFGATMLAAIVPSGLALFRGIEEISWLALPLTAVNVVLAASIIALIGVVILGTETITHLRRIGAGTWSMLRDDPDRRSRLGDNGMVALA